MKDNVDDTIEEIKRTYVSKQRPDLSYHETVFIKNGNEIERTWKFKGKEASANYVSEDIAKRLEKYWKEAKKMPGVTKENLVRMVEKVPRCSVLNGRVFGFIFLNKNAERFYSAPITKITQNPEN